MENDDGHKMKVKKGQQNFVDKSKSKTWNQSYGSKKV